MIGWEDDVNGMDSHNLIYDIPELVEHSEGPLFSIVKEWRMERKDEGPDDEEENANEKGDEDETAVVKGTITKDESEASLYA